MTQSSWDSGLTDEQKSAVTQTGKTARLLAGPGTGKTQALGRKCVYLVKERSVHPSDILVLTFTRLAAKELRERIISDLEGESSIPHISTLHGFALRQLRRNQSVVGALPLPLRVADDWEENNIIEEDLKTTLHLGAGDINERFRALSADWQTLVADKDDWEVSHLDRTFIGAWKEHRTIYGYTLRSELVYQLKRALEQSADFALEPRFRYVFIDEYQDLNPCDLAVTSALVNDGLELFACGDDDQSIYGFRHASPTGIRKFPDSFPDSVSLNLTLCWRCDAEILNAALDVAKEDPRRIPKELVPAIDHQGGTVELLRFRSGGEEADGIARICRWLVDRGIALSEILILLRSDRNKVFSRPMREALERQGLASTAAADKTTPLDLREGRRLFSLLRLLLDPSDHLAWRTRLMTAGRLGPRTIEPIYDFARREGIGFSHALSRLDEYADTIPAGTLGQLLSVVTQTHSILNRHLWLTGPAVGAFENSHADTSMLDAIAAIAESDIAEPDHRQPVLDYIGEIAANFATSELADLMTALSYPLDEAGTELDRNQINILTMHQAKGLSADAVLIVGVEDEILPQAEDGHSIDENRRLLYVSMTRARHYLFMTYAGNRTGAQAHTGRNSGSPKRQLTRYLRDGDRHPVDGIDYLQRLLQ